MIRFSESTRKPGESEFEYHYRLGHRFFVAGGDVTYESSGSKPSAVKIEKGTVIYVNKLIPISYNSMVLDCAAMDMTYTAIGSDRKLHEERAELTVKEFEQLSSLLKYDDTAELAQSAYTNSHAEYIRRRKGSKLCQTIIINTIGLLGPAIAGVIFFSCRFSLSVMSIIGGGMAGFVAGILMLYIALTVKMHDNEQLAAPDSMVEPNWADWWALIAEWKFNSNNEGHTNENAFEDMILGRTLWGAESISNAYIAPVPQIPKDNELDGTRFPADPMPKEERALFIASLRDQLRLEREQYDCLYLWRTKKRSKT